MIEVQQLSRRYGSLMAVDEVSFRIGRGEIVGLLGHNGAGKTTIMKMLTGFLEPTAGRILIDGAEVTPESAGVRRRIGYLPENCPLWPEMSVLEYLDYQAALHGVAAAERDAAVARAVGRTALRDKAAAPIGTLSRGYRQRVGVAQALLHDPEIVILDEPTNGLDPSQILHMRDLIRELSASATVIVSTHILQEVQAVCQRALILRAGRLVVDSRIDDLARVEALRVTAGAGAADVLAALPGVRRVVDAGSEGGLQRLRLEADPRVAPEVARALTQAGIALHALEPERQDLESVFARVSSELSTEASHA